MKTKEVKLPVQTRPKSIMDYTPGELAEIQAYQNKNRGYREIDSEIELENINDWED